MSAPPDSHAGDSLSSPDQLDNLVQVSSSASWLLLIAFSALVVASLIWGVFGRIDTRVESEGVFLGGSIHYLAARGSGQVLAIRVAPGDSVSPGQVVAEIEQPDLDRQLADAQTKLSAAQDDYEQLKAFSQREAELKREYLQKQRETLERSIQEAQDRLQVLTGQMANERELADKGVLTQRDLLPTLDTFNATNSNLERSRAELTQLRSTELRDQFNAGKDLLTAERAIFDAQREVDEARDDLARKGQIVSTAAGVVLAVLAEQGGLVSDGQDVIKLGVSEPDTRDLYVLAYVPADEAKKVSVGMDVNIAPNTALPEKDGYVRGRVLSVSAFPATNDEMKLALKNEPLVARLAKSGEPFRVEIEVLKEPETPSGLAWTSGSGPDLVIDSGTLAKVFIVVDRRRPIELVIPSIKGLVGQP